MKPVFKAVAIVSAMNFASRILGFVFKFYLVRHLGAINMGVYQVAISVFFVFATFICSGIPLIISKISARKNTNSLSGIYKLNESQAVSSGIAVSIFFSIAIAIILFLGSKIISKAFVSLDSFICLLFLLPALVASGISSSVRGAMWGQGKYTLASFIEIFEQLLRIGLCVLVFFIGTNKLYATAWTFSLSCLLVSILCIFYYIKKGGKLKFEKKNLKPLFVASLPITGSRISGSLVNMLLAFVIPLLFSMRGMSTDEGLLLLGVSLGMALPLLYTPITIIGSLAYIMLPTLSNLSANKKSSELTKEIENTISISIVIACAFIPIFIILGKSAGLLLFGDNLAGDFLTYSAWILIPIAFESITSSMMNALELERKGLLNFCIGSIIMFSIMLACYKFFSLQIFSIAFGVSLTCSSILDLLAVRKKTQIKLTFFSTLLQCILIVIPTIFIVGNIYKLLQHFDTSNVAINLTILSATALLCIFVFALLSFIFDVCGVTLLFGIKNQKNIFGKTKKNYVKNGIMDSGDIVKKSRFRKKTTQKIV